VELLGGAMSIVYNRFNRRQFLLGTGGAVLTLPLLPSLLPSQARAQAMATPPRMMLFVFEHNPRTHLWPQRSVATTAVGSAGMREAMVRSIGSLGPVLTNARYDSLRQSDQLTFLRGFNTEQAYGPGHGNYGLACGAGRNSEGGYPSIESVVETSRTVYPTSTPSNVTKAVRISLNGDSMFYKKVGGSVQAIDPYRGDGVRTFYDQVFQSLTMGTTAPVDNTNSLKSNILNRVHGSFASFKANRKISRDDMARLDEHMGMIADLQRGLASTVNTPPSMPLSCAKPNLGTGDQHVLYMDLLAAAMRCNLTQFGAFVLDGNDSAYGGGNFHDAVHEDRGTAIPDWWRRMLNLIADRFLAPLDTMEGNTGRTYLQNMITGIVCAGGLESPGGHSGLDSQQILIGSMGGKLRSGRYYSMPNGNAPLNMFQLTLLKLMGMPPSEYAFATPNGRGFGYYGSFTNHAMGERVYGPITEALT
jgi:Protein of unknown function (DUF1552)